MDLVCEQLVQPWPEHTFTKPNPLSTTHTTHTTNPKDAKKHKVATPPLHSTTNTLPQPFDFCDDETPEKKKIVTLRHVPDDSRLGTQGLDKAITVQYMSKVGRGAFADCWLVRVLPYTRQPSHPPHRLGQEAPPPRDSLSKARRRVCVLKISPRGCCKWRDEIRIHRRVSHAHIVRLYTYFTTATSAYIVLQWCPGMSLSQHIRRLQKKRKPTVADSVARNPQVLSIKSIATYTNHIASALMYLHDKGIVHRDVKPGNVLLSRDFHIAKLGDFGLSTRWKPGDPLMKRCVGTPAYLAPEALTKRPKYTNLVDVWALGCTMFAMIEGKSPWKELQKTRKVMFQKIKSSQSPPQPTRPVPTPLWRIVRSLMCPVSQRLTAAQVVRITSEFE